MTQGEVGMGSAEMDQHIGKRVSTETELPLRFARTVLPHLSDALDLAQRLAGTRPAADDLLREAFLRAFVSIDDFGNRNVRAWLLTTVFSAWLGRRTAAPPSMDGNAQNEVAEAPDKPNENAASAIRAIGLAPGPSPNQAQVEQSIASLPTIFREVLLLRRQGLSYNRISEVVGVPIGTVMSRLARARRRMRQALSEGSA